VTVSNGEIYIPARFIFQVHEICYLYKGICLNKKIARFLELIRGETISNINY